MLRLTKTSGLATALVSQIERHIIQKIHILAGMENSLFEIKKIFNLSIK